MAARESPEKVGKEPEGLVLGSMREGRRRMHRQAQDAAGGNSGDRHGA
jgi:hypothetical protein